MSPIYLSRSRRACRVALSLLVASLSACGGAGDTPSTPADPPPPPPPATLAITAAPSLITVAQGQSATTTLTIVRGGHAAPVSIDAATAPAGLTVTPPGGRVASATATLGVQAAASVSAGDYPIAITASADGIAPVATSVIVRVTAVVQQPTEPDVLSGIALDAQGQPLADVLVQAKMVWNPNVARTHTGTNGRYAFRGLPAGLSHQVLAWHQVEYAGRSYCVRLGMPSVGDYDAFVPDPGVVRDFRWKLTGRIPDAGKNYFGATLVLVAATDFTNPVLETDDTVEVTLTPHGPLVDGSQGQVITRSVRYAATGWDSRLADIPHGVYTAQVTRVRGGVRTALRVSRLDSSTPTASATVEWEPDHPGSCGQVLGSDLRAFSLRLENP